jgi:hypothetical protein
MVVEPHLADLAKRRLKPSHWKQIRLLEAFLLIAVLAAGTIVLILPFDLSELVRVTFSLAFFTSALPLLVEIDARLRDREWRHYRRRTVAFFLGYATARLLIGHATRDATTSPGPKGATKFSERAKQLLLELNLGDPTLLSLVDSIGETGSPIGGSDPYQDLLRRTSYLLTTHEQAYFDFWRWVVARENVTRGLVGSWEPTRVFFTSLDPGLERELGIDGVEGVRVSLRKLEDEAANLNLRIEDQLRRTIVVVRQDRNPFVLSDELSMFVEEYARIGSVDLNLKSSQQVVEGSTDEYLGVSIGRMESEMKSIRHWVAGAKTVLANLSGESGTEELERPPGGSRTAPSLRGPSKAPNPARSAGAEISSREGPDARENWERAAQLLLSRFEKRMDWLWERLVTGEG